MPTPKPTSNTAIDMPVTVDGEPRVVQVETTDPTTAAAEPAPAPKPTPRSTPQGRVNPDFAVFMPTRTAPPSAAAPEGYVMFAAHAGEREAYEKRWFPTKAQAREYGHAHRAQHPDRDQVLIWAKPCEGWELVVEGNPSRRFVYPTYEQCEAMRERLAEVIPDLQASIEPFVFVPKPKSEDPPKTA